MKYSRPVIGILLILLSIWVIVGEQMSGASADAVVNAPIVTIRAPVAGNLTIPERQLGGRVTQGEVLASIEDPIADRVRLNDLLMEVRLEEAARAQIAELLAETGAIRDDLNRRADIFRTNRLEELQTRLTHARSRLAILEQEQAAVPDPRLLEAVEEDDQRLPAEPRLDALVLDHARERVAILQIALNAAQQGVFLGDGYNDAPNAEQRSVELRSEIAALNTRLAEADARVTAVGERADRERLRVNSQIGGDLQSPVTGIFWDVLQADGVNVQRGDPLLRIVDCSSTVVTLSVTERTYNDLAVGQPARFRLAGSSEVHDATVARLAGSGAATIYQAMAVAPSQKHLERFDVALIVPALRDGGADNCVIGQTGRAFFETRPLDGLRGLFN